MMILMVMMIPFLTTHSETVSSFEGPLQKETRTPREDLACPQAEGKQR